MEVINPGEKEKQKKTKQNKRNLNTNYLFSSFEVVGLQSKKMYISVSRARLFSWSLNKPLGSKTLSYSSNILCIR